MNCEDFSNVVLDIAREKILEASSRAAALKHARGCACCRLRLEDEERLSRQLRGLAEAMKFLSATPEINPLVIATLRGHSRVFSFRAMRRPKIWAAAGAAIVLLVVGLAAQLTNVLLEPNRSAVDPPQANQIKTLQPQNAAIDLTAMSLKPSQISTKHKSKAIPRHAPTSRSSNSTGARSITPRPAIMKNEIATGFFQVGDTSPSSLADGGQLVRVELPRSALMSFGLPMNTDRANERVKADVLVGSDGIARAIRFIR